MDINTQKAQKKMAATFAVNYIKDGMTVGLGTGSTATYFIEALNNKIKEENWHVTCVTTSSKSAKLANSLGMNVVDIDDVETIDVTVDGADEFDENLNGIKGGGAALLFEKIVAKSSTKNIWIVDSSKRSQHLGSFKLPVEVVKFGAQHIFNKLAKLSLQPKFRLTDLNEKLITDSGHYIIDIDIKEISDISTFSNTLKSFTGVVEHGLFINICNLAIIGGETITVLENKNH